ncbi:MULTISPECIES: enolase C-terminal domain-like protein [unclassified Variovorax]|uniref:enolase C-terminal domain-like protein n=1 Tax=unclassified Variovorax TaxID=663243 RepID=UPI0008D15776|nr:MULTISPECIES: enolase C-terminal domain-like protein [unclassified Variovorax]SEJ48835.1 mandelate racemase [Variovorax sp. OK202]SFC50256.1 mandelate racemase [Variovorax sp. OK212]
MNEQNIPIRDLPTITAITVRAVAVPLQTPLRTASGTMAVAPILLFDVTTSDRAVGRGYIFTYTPTALAAARRLAEDVGALTLGQQLAPREIMTALRARFRLIGTPGLLDMVLAGLDMAVWDAWARFLDQPLVRVLGGRTDTTVKAYASYGMDGSEQAATDVGKAVDAGFHAVKIKIGYPTLAEDLAAVRTARKAGGDRARLMVDYNQALSVPEAVRRCRALEQEDLIWIEEPVAFDDNLGHAHVASEIATPLQLGENLFGARQVARSIRDQASDFMMPDLMKVGGVSGWIDAAAICAAASMPVSNHFFQEISVHMLAVTPTADYLEYFPMVDALLQDPLRVEAGVVQPPERPGNGMDWREECVDKYRF